MANTIIFVSINPSPVWYTLIRIRLLDTTAPSRIIELSSGEAMRAIWLTAPLLLRLVLALPLNAPLLPSYDYISMLSRSGGKYRAIADLVLVVGGGPAGLTVANRLSEDPKVNVLLLEAGPADQGEPSVQLPAMIGNNIGSIYDWNLSTVAQTYLDAAPRSIPQGHALGGGTVINGMLWNRGGVGDYDEWVRLGNPGW